MGALPDREPPPGAPHRRPEQAPPLRAVPGPRPAPEPEPGPETAPPPAPPPAPEPEKPAPAPEATEEHTPTEEDRPARWAGLRPPDIWNTPAPTLREEIARVRRGDHLPDSGPWRVAEQTRMWVSALLIAGLLLLVHVNRSAARQAVFALFIAALVLLVR